MVLPAPGETALPVKTVQQSPTLKAPVPPQPLATTSLTAKQNADAKRDYDLFQAAFKGETWHIRELLAAGAHINATDWQYGFTPLMWAAKKGNLGAVRYLLKQGAKVNTRSKVGVPIAFEGSIQTRRLSNGKTYRASLVASSGGIGALDIATASGWGLTARELLLQGAAVNATDPEGSTALAAAAYQADLDTVKAMLSDGAHINATDSMGRGPLWMAALSGNEAVVRELLAHGAKPMADMSGAWPGDVARAMGHTEVAAMLMRTERLAKANRPPISETLNQLIDPGPAAVLDSALAEKNGIIVLN